MTVVDASALEAILAHEPEREAFLDFLILNATTLSPIGYWETAVAARRVLGHDGNVALDTLMDLLNITIAPATGATAAIAATALVNFGKGTAAKLNLGDCFAYALAKELNAPLLFRGDDFTRTEVKSALTA